jgi:hypothetical protein
VVRAAQAAIIRIGSAVTQARVMTSIRGKYLAKIQIS